VLQAAACALALAACASTPPTHFYTLVGAEPPPPRADAPRTGGPTVLLDPVKVPPQVEQPQWLLRQPDDTLVLLEQERWVTALPDEVHQALLEILTARFGAVDARTPGAGAARWRVRVDLSRFDSKPGESRIDGSWALVRSTRGGASADSATGAAASGTSGAAAPSAGPAGGLGGEIVARCTIAQREAAGPGMAALADAHRRNIARLGEAIGQALLAAARGQAVDCAAVSAATPGS
jgi:uncharacterized lipoprotein YmbA